MEKRNIRLTQKQLHKVAYARFVGDRSLIEVWLGSLNKAELAEVEKIIKQLNKDIPEKGFCVEDQLRT